MKAMILAAGVGTRLRPLTDRVPKPMLPIAGEPLLAHTLCWLQRYGVREIALNLHYLPEVIRDGLGDGSRWGLHLRYSVEPTLLGTAGAVKRLADFFDETFLVIYGDLLIDVDLAALIELHRRQAALMTIALKPTDTPHSQGMVAVDTDGRVARFVEKPAEWPADQRVANAGIYVVEPAVLQQVPTDQPYDWGHDVLPRLIASGAPVYGLPVAGQVIDIGTLAVYERYREHGLLDRGHQPADQHIPIPGEAARR